LSKLVRAVEDALTDAGVGEDDSQVVVVRAVCLYGARGETVITVEGAS
jgi:Holliday junction resolvase RusA-like endonuclease